MFLLLAASSFFFPHYSVTHDQRPFALLTDPNGNAYVSSYTSYTSGGAEFSLSKVDPDGRLIYRVRATDLYAATAINLNAATADDHGNLYGSTIGSGTYFALKLDPAGKVVYRLQLPLGEPAPPAVGPDGSAYFTGSGAPSVYTPATTPGVWVTDAGAAPNKVNAMVVKVSPAGDRIVYSTFLNNAPPPK